MTIKEYEIKIINLYGKLQDLMETIDEAKNDIKTALLLLDFLPEISDLEENDKNDHRY